MPAVSLSLHTICTPDAGKAWVQPRPLVKRAHPRLGSHRDGRHAGHGLPRAAYPRRGADDPRRPVLQPARWTLRPKLSYDLTRQPGGGRMEERWLDPVHLPKVVDAHRYAVLETCVYQ